jgi:TrmH family RNA methyltransferase
MITSLQNPKIKEISTFVNKPSLLSKKALLLIEGLKEISIAVECNVRFKTVFFCAKIIDNQDVMNIIGEINSDCEIIEVAEHVFAKIAYRKTTGGILVLAERPTKKLSDLKINDESIFIILDALEKPGNLGAICRVADAANVSGVIVTNIHTDLYNANAIRSSLGCVFSVDVVCADFEETINWLNINGIKTLAAELQNSNYYQNMDFSGKIAFVFGTEATGLPAKWLENSDNCIKIPMQGKIDSLNVNTSVAIIVFEAKRQKLMKK